MAQDDFNTVNPIYGEEYGLIEKNKGLYNGFRHFSGIYIGRNSNRTDWFSTQKGPEGFLFAVRDNNQEAGIYTQRTDELKMTWLIDDEEGPVWLEGIWVSKFQGELKKSENHYLANILERHENKLEEAA